MPTFPEFWLRPTALSGALLPLAWMFRAATAVRRGLYRRRVLASIRLGVPVIVVGNLIVGGTGKTPLVLALVDELRRAGYHPGVITRGYGGRSRAPAQVSAGEDPAKAGDEAVLLARRGGCPVYAGADRAAAARMLLRLHPQCDVLVSDDGLQHYRLARDLEISVEDARGHGNGWMLPAGPLREPARRHVDARVVNEAAHAFRLSELEREGPWFRMSIQPQHFYALEAPGIPLSAEQFTGRRLHAIAGIGEPARFFSLLRAMGLHAAEHAFPDHHAFRAEELDFAACDAVLMTEKDAVKCERLARKDTRRGWYALQVGARLDPSFFDFILTRLRGAHHGHPAA